MKRLGPFLIVSLLAACATLPPEGDGANLVARRPDGRSQPDAVGVPGDAQPIGWAGVGRVGPDGAPLVTTPVATAPVVADRGIGGTGGPAATASDNRIADRGIGGTGIVGVVTGFGSVFVDGMEIEYDTSASVDIDGVASPASALRAGQLVAIRAEGSAAAPRARMISVQSVVMGRIEALELGTGTLTVAGQAVSVPAGTWGGNRFGLGDWVKVSGLRRADQTIVASRLDAAPAGVLLARGQVVRDGKVMRVGKLALSAPMAAGVKEGQFVIVSGNYAAGRGHVSAVTSDSLLPDPAGFFGPSANRLVVQAFVEVDGGSISMNGMTVAAKPAVVGLARHDGIAVVALERGPSGSYVAVGLRYADYRGHTETPFRPGRGSGRADPSQALQRNGHASAIAPQQAYGDGSGSAANGQVATTTTVSNAYAASGASNETPTPTPTLTPGPPRQDLTPTVTTKPTPMSLTPIPPSGENPTLPPAATLVPTPAPTTTPTPTPTTSTAPPTAAPSAPPPTGVPMVESVSLSSPPTRTVASHNGGGTAAAVNWKAVQSATHRWGPITVKSSTSSPTLNLLTGAVTSAATTKAGIVSLQPGARAKAFTSSALRKSTTKIGTSSGKHWSGPGSHPGKH